MKKLALSLIACVAFAQSAYGLVGITSNLGTSLRIQSAIIESIGTTSVIPQNEFIVEIEKKKKREIDLNVVQDQRWLIKTVEPRDDGILASVDLDPDLESFNVDPSETEALLFRKRAKSHTYEAIVRITPNPAVGPPLVEVLSITKRS